ncbi:sigma-54 dependent transcriptional regulator [uncultured Bacteroides sp.]|uniref:sigma-54-dependent transcriptional regulator n=2 Tax=Bacteroides TaxID=816 RepID=UPI0026E545FB|nr:sigma 54-interacting transcriptional regulator [uncultured Bacteroides sp.]
MNKILIVDASVSDNRVMSSLIVRAGYDPIISEKIEAAKEEVVKLPPGAVIVTAMRLPDGTAKEFINWLKAEGYKFPVIAIVENLNNADVVSIMRGGGAVDVIQRPAIDKQLIETVAQYVKAENKTFSLGKHLIPRQSDEWREIVHKVQSIAKSNANVIIFGASGTGKEQVALEIYHQSPRSQKPHIIVDAGGAGLIGKHDPSSERSETYNRIKSYFENADGGTIIMKNLHLLNFEKQSVLLHILEEEHPNVRVICTAEPYLRRMMTEQSFRPNLMYILREFEIVIPSLHEVTEDIPLLANFFLKIYAGRTEQTQKRLDASAIKALKQHLWIGNVRELKNVILQAAFGTKGNVITSTDLTFNVSDPEDYDDIHLKNPSDEKRRITDALKRTAWNKTQAAKLLKISRPTLDYKIRQYGIRKNEV